MVVVEGLIVRGGQIAVSKSMHRYVVRLPQGTSRYHQDQRVLLNLMEAIARGNSASPCADMWLGLDMREIKVSQRPRSTYGMHPGVDSRIGQNGAGAHPTLPVMSNSHSVTRAEGFTHGALAKGTMERCGYSLLGMNLSRRVPAGHCVQAVQIGRVCQLYQCQSSETQARQNLRFTGHTCATMQPRSTGRASVISASIWVSVMME